MSLDVGGFGCTREVKSEEERREEKRREEKKFVCVPEFASLAALETTNEGSLGHK